MVIQATRFIEHIFKSFIWSEIFGTKYIVIFCYSVCIPKSLFVHTTISPWLIVIGLGSYALSPSLEASETMDTMLSD